MTAVTLPPLELRGDLLERNSYAAARYHLKFARFHRCHPCENKSQSSSELIEQVLPMQLPLAASL